ncbi:nuclear transport factor 2 family protein [Pseudonocardia sp. ICBG1293]|uniref:nuclear transport factor 2 family protein n=1 Tax=Pseudonocardia sp. ICBG1293 TaxID=2844382 RepID=UPI001CCB0261|nr:nuclear transport factor 2 family protein [Pseudonocardia sp. ICBG1293]
MTDEPIRTFLDAVHSGDPERMQAVLAADVVLNSPILDEPIVGSGPATAVLGLLSSIIDDLTFGEVLTGEIHVAVHLTGTVDAHPIEAVDRLEFDPAGRVRTMTVLARPLAAVVALQNRLAPTLGAPALALVPEGAGGPGASV